MKIEFDKKIYNGRAVNAAVKDYREFAEFKVDSDKETIVVNIEDIDYPDAGEFLGEFCNYVIHKMSVSG